MAKRKIQYRVHGAFSTRADADKCARGVTGKTTIRKFKLRGQTRYAVISKK